MNEHEETSLDGDFDPFPDDKTLLDVQRRSVRLRDGAFNVNPHFVQIVQLLLEGKNKQEIIACTGLTSNKVHRALRYIEDSGFIELHLSVEKFLAHQRFYELYDEIKRIDPESDEGILFFTELMMLAPPELKAQFHAKAEEMGLFPTARLCDSEGRPLFSAQDVADHLGVDVAEVEAFSEMLHERLGDASGVLLAGPKDINRIN